MHKSERYSLDNISPLEDLDAAVGKLEDALSELGRLQFRRTRFIASVFEGIRDAKEKKKAILHWNCLNFLLRCKARSEALIQGVLYSLRDENHIMGMLAARAHIETTGTLGYFLYNLKEYASNEIEFKEMTKVLARLTVGSRIKSDLTDLSSISVLTLIAAADKLIAGAHTEKRGMLRNCYEELSEFCYPNLHGLHFSVSHFRKDMEFAEPAVDPGYLVATFISIKTSTLFLKEGWDLMKPETLKYVHLEKAES